MKMSRGLKPGMIKVVRVYNRELTPTHSTSVNKQCNYLELSEKIRIFAS